MLRCAVKTVQWFALYSCAGELAKRRLWIAALHRSSAFCWQVQEQLMVKRANDDKLPDPLPGRSTAAQLKNNPQWICGYVEDRAC